MPLLGLALLAACSASTASDEPTLSVRLDEWSVDISTGGTPSGGIDIEVTNDGLLMHEAVIVASDHPEQPLVTVNGLVDIAEADVELVGEIADLSPADDIRVTIDLEPGTYVFFCNIAGHYDSGMHATLRVEG